MKKKQCVLYDRDCIDCGECDMCELNPEKRCDNCMRCVNGDAEYRAVYVDQVIAPEKNTKEKRTNV